MQRIPTIYEALQTLANHCPLETKLNWKETCAQRQLVGKKHLHDVTCAGIQHVLVTLWAEN